MPKETKKKKKLGEKNEAVKAEAQEAIYRQSISLTKRVEKIKKKELKTLSEKYQTRNRGVRKSKRVRERRCARVFERERGGSVGGSSALAPAKSGREEKRVSETASSSGNL